MEENKNQDKFTNTDSKSNTDRLFEDESEENFPKASFVTNILKKALTTLDDLSVVSKEKESKKYSFDEYIDIMSNNIDNKIIETVKKDKNKKYVGGYIFFKISSDNKYLLFKVCIYFKNDKDQWYTTEYKGKEPISAFIRETSEEQLKEIWETQKNGEEFKLEITPPSEIN